MNELIKKLAEQAASNFTQNFNWEYLLQTDRDIFKKFAELIIKECIGVIEDSEGYSQHFPHVVENIEKHFNITGE